MAGSSRSAGRWILPLLVALPLSLGLRALLHWTGEAGGRAHRTAVLEATRDTLRERVRLQKITWNGEIEMTWRPRVQAGWPDSIASDFVLVAITRATPLPAAVPPELLRWTDRKEAAPPDRVGGWLANRLTTSDSRRYLVARALPPGTGAEISRVAEELSRLTDERPSPAALVLSYLGPFLLAFGALAALQAVAGRRNARAADPAGP